MIPKCTIISTLYDTKVYYLQAHYIKLCYDKFLLTTWIFQTEKNFPIFCIFPDISWTILEFPEFSRFPEVCLLLVFLPDSRPATRRIGEQKFCCLQSASSIPNMAADTRFKIFAQIRYWYECHSSPINASI